MRNIIRLTESDFHRIINESVRKIIKEAMTEDGTMTYKNQVFQYKGDFDNATRKRWMAWRKRIDDAEARERGEEVPEPEKPKRGKKQQKETMSDDQASPKALAANVKNLIYDKALKTVFVFVWHGDVSFKKEQINRIHALYTGENIKNGREDPLNKFNTIYRDIERRVNDIENWGSKNEHAVYNKVYELAYLLEDLNNVLVTLCKITINLKQKGKFEEFKKVIDPQTKQVIGIDNRPAVLYGRGGNREYGLLGLVFASPQNLDKLQTEILNNIRILKDISKNGRDAFEYDPNDLRKKG